MIVNNHFFRLRTRFSALLVLAAFLFLQACKEATPVTASKDVFHKAAAASPSVVELIVNNPDSSTDVAISNLVAEFGLPAGSLYRWHERYFIFGVINDKAALTAALRKALPTAVVRDYAGYFYAFERSRCAVNDTTGDTGEWRHIMLTAALVPDTTLQREYMDAHATQFEKWPEVARGFCQAKFRQLLLYRKDDQLVLIISIPADKTLDELNPLTTQDNPRVEEWNQQMKKYQQGLPGTDSSEVWVFPEVLK